MNFTLRFAWAGMLFAALLSFAKSNADEPISAADCGAMLRTVRNNYASVNSFDVLLRYERLEDGEGVSKIFTRTCRLAFDSANRVAAISVVKEFDNLLRTERSRAAAFLFVGGLTTLTDFESQPATTTSLSYEKCLEQAGIANLFLIGATSFPDATHRKDRVDGRWNEAFGAVSNYGSAALKGKRVEADVVFPFQKGKFGENSVRWNFTFDAASSLPTSFSCSYLRKSAEEMKSTSRYRSSFEWGEPTKGVFLPTSMFIKEAGWNRDKEEALVATENVTTVEIDWISVNSPIDEKIWEVDALMDYASAIKFCSPIESGKR